MLLKTTKGLFLVRPYRRGDEQLICNSWAQAFGKTFPLSLWHWKYAANPCGFAALLCFSESGDLAVHYAGQFQKVFWKEKSFLALHLADNFTHPAYRWAVGGKKSLFARVARIFWRTYLKNAPFEEEGLNLREPQADFLWGIPGWRHFRLGELVVHYSRQPFPAFYAVRRGIIPKAKGPIPRVFLEKEISPKAYQHLWRKHRQLVPCGVEKDWPFFTWRYLSHPAKPYLFSILEEPKELKGLLVLREEGEDLVLVDLLVSDLLSLWDLLQGTLRLFPNKKIKVWLAGNSPFKEVFLAAGWEEEREPLGIVPAIQGFFPEIKILASEFSWAMGDADLF